MIKRDVLHKTLKAFAELHISHQKEYIKYRLRDCDIIVRSVLLSKLNSLAPPNIEILEGFGYSNISIANGDLHAAKDETLHTSLSEENLIGDIFDFNSIESKEIYRLMMQNMVAGEKIFVDAYEASVFSFIGSLGDLESLKKDLEIKNANLPLRTQITESISIDFLLFFENEFKD